VRKYEHARAGSSGGAPLLPIPDLLVLAAMNAPIDRQKILNIRDRYGCQHLIRNVTYTHHAVRQVTDRLLEDVPHHQSVSKFTVSAVVRCREFPLKQRSRWRL